jgi:hypothetical protein
MLIRVTVVMKPSRTSNAATYTGGGGQHFLMRHRPGITNAQGGLPTGIDVRGDGGYVVAPPSVHPNGGTYAWDVDAHPDETALADWPDWLLAIVSTRQCQGAPHPPRRHTDHHRAARGGQHLLVGLVKAVARVPEGSRNNTLFWAACRLGEGVVAGQISKAFGAAALEYAAARAGLEATEAQRTIASGLTRGAE